MLCATTLAARLLRHCLTSCRTCCKAEDFASPASEPFPLWHRCRVGFHLSCPFSCMKPTAAHSSSDLGMVSCPSCAPFAHG